MLLHVNVTKVRISQSVCSISDAVAVSAVTRRRRASSFVEQQLAIEHSQLFASFVDQKSEDRILVWINGAS